MTPAAIERQLRWLMTLRIVVVTTLLVSAFAIELLFRPAESLRPLFLLTGVAYGASLLWAALERWVGRTRGYALMQLGGDALLITAFVQITGGLGSPMSFLYLLPVAVAALVLYRGEALVVALGCYALYAVLVTAGAGWQALGAAAPKLSGPPGRVLYALVAHLVAMVAVALLASSLADRVRRQGYELAERSRAVARLQALNENIIESINSGLLTTDLAGGVNFINRGGTAITGYTQAAIEGRAIEEVFALEPGSLAELRRRLSAERRVRFERDVELPGARRIFMGLTVSPLHDKAGHALGYVFIFQDLTEIRALEQEVRLKERMAALGEMAAGMAHELRNPLAAVSGAVQYLTTELEPEGEVRELMEIILRESQRLDQTIRDFLTFARPGDFAPQEIDLVRLIDDNVKLLRKSRELGPAHRLTTRYAAPRMLCRADPNRLRQVFWNLATNALKAMPGGGELRIELLWAAGGEQVEIAFSDEGVGMDEEQKERYFQPFAGSFSEGTGLGAAMVYRLVEEHAGRIDLESERACGTRVRVLLPTRVSALPGVAPPAPALRCAAGGEGR